MTNEPKTCKASKRTTSEFSRRFIAWIHHCISHGDTSGTCNSGLITAELLLLSYTLLLVCGMLRFPVLLTSAEVGVIISATSWRGVCTHTTILRQESTAVCRFGSESNKYKLRTLATVAFGDVSNHGEGITKWH